MFLQVCFFFPQLIPQAAQSLCLPDVKPRNNYVCKAMLIQSVRQLLLSSCSLSFEDGRSHRHTEVKCKRETVCVGLLGGSVR